MPRLTENQYQWRAMLAAGTYIAAMLIVWPLGHSAASVPVKAMLALLPLLPMFYLIGMAAWRIQQSDELEQRLHLIALGVSSAVVATLSLAGGFLASAKVMSLDGRILIWVFPLMVSCYSVTRWWLARGYGASGFCASGGVPMYLRFLLAGAVLSGVAWSRYTHNDSEGMYTCLGMAAAFVAFGVFFGLRYWWMACNAVQGDEHR
jgi:hypothetical protein